MEYLITSTTGAYYVNGNNIKRFAKYDCYGITWTNDKIFILERIEDRHSYVHVYDKTLRHLNKKFIKEFTYNHQTLYVPKFQRIYMASTKDNMIKSCTVNLKNIISYPRWNKESHQHTNTIWWDGKHFWSCEHRGKLIRKNPNRRSRLVRLNQNMCIVDTFDDDWIHLHGAYKEGDYIYTCSSEDSYLIKYDLQNRIINKKILLKNIGIMHEQCTYVRGMAKYPNGFLIGVSLRGPRDNRDKNDNPASVITLNNNLEIHDIVNFQVGQINQIRLLNIADKSHNGISMTIERGK